jgi:hypothetical protein
MRKAGMAGMAGRKTRHPFPLLPAFLILFLSDSWDPHGRIGRIFFPPQKGARTGAKIPVRTRLWFFLRV